MRESLRVAASCFLQALLSAVYSGDAALNQIAIALSRRTGYSITKQGGRQRFSERSTAFLTSVVQGLICARFSARAVTRRLGCVRRVVVEDSSIQWSSARFSNGRRQWGNKA